MFASALLSWKPQDGYLPKRFEEKKSKSRKEKKIKEDLAFIGLNEAIKTPRFYGLGWCYL